MIQTTNTACLCSATDFPKQTKMVTAIGMMVASMQGILSAEQGANRLLVFCPNLALDSHINWHYCYCHSWMWTEDPQPKWSHHQSQLARQVPKQERVHLGGQCYPWPPNQISKWPLSFYSADCPCLSWLTNWEGGRMFYLS